MSQRAEYCEFLNSAFAKTQHRRPNGRGVPGAGNDLFFDARASSLSGRWRWDGRTFSVLDGKENHPIIGGSLTADLLQDRETVEPWQHDVQNNGVNVSVERLFEPIGSRVCQ